MNEYEEWTDLIIEITFSHEFGRNFVIVLIWIICTVVA